jgi:hypothetical protein
MRLVDWLLGRGPTGEHSPISQPVQPADFMEIPSRSFYGECFRSPNRRYTLAWGDANDSGTRRKSGYGYYFLLEGTRIIAEGRISRPNDGKVANNGTFVLNDWGLGDGLKGMFLAFDSLGDQLIRRKFRANLFNNGLSLDGRFAACQACNAADSPDGSVLAVFDLTRAVEIGKWIPESGWADFYEFEDGVIRLGYRNLGTFGYTSSGEFLDREAWYEAQLAKGDYGSALLVAERLIRAADGKPVSQLAARLIEAIDRVVPAIVSTDVKTQAWAMKLRGLCIDARGDLHGALGCYERALALDPKVGVRRRAEQIRKSLGGQDFQGR